MPDVSAQPAAQTDREEVVPAHKPGEHNHPKRGQLSRWPRRGSHQQPGMALRSTSCRGLRCRSKRSSGAGSTIAASRGMDTDKEHKMWTRLAAASEEVRVASFPPERGRDLLRPPKWLRAASRQSVDTIGCSFGRGSESLPTRAQAQLLGRGECAASEPKAVRCDALWFSALS